MIWIDFSIICIGQEQPSVPLSMKDFVFENYERTSYSEPFYNEDYHFYTADKLTGYWYNIWLLLYIYFDKRMKKTIFAGCNLVLIGFDLIN